MKINEAVKAVAALPPTATPSPAPTPTLEPSPSLALALALIRALSVQGHRRVRVCAA